MLLTGVSRDIRSCINLFVLSLFGSLTAVDRRHQSFCLHLPQPDFDNFAVYITEEDITCIVAIKIWVYWISGLGAEKLCNPNFDGFLLAGESIIEAQK